MNKLGCSLMCMLLAIGLSAQQFPWENIHLPDFYKKESKKLSDRNADFYVVDSLYCYFYEPGLQMDIPTTRQYNLDFTEEDGEVLESIEQSYNMATGLWENQKHVNFIIDDQNNLVEQTTQVWDAQNGAWVNDFRTLNTPSSNGDYTAVLNLEWHGPSGDWRNVDRLNLEYDQDGFIELLEQELWDTLTNNWQKNFRILYAVNGAGEIASTLFQLWQSGDYKNISRTISTFDTVDPALEIESLTEVWNGYDQVWFKSSRRLKEYSIGNLTTETNQLWNAPDTSWQNDIRFLRNYNADNEITLKTDLIWNGSQWVNFFQTINSYDTVGNLVNYEVLQWQVTEWQALNHCDFYWSFHHEVVSTFEGQNLDCKIPNPYKIGSNIRCPELLGEEPTLLAIYDLSGKIVYTKRLDNQNFINIAQPLSTGIYVLTISNKNGLLDKRKLVILE